MDNKLTTDQAHSIYNNLKQAISQQGMLFIYIGKTLKDIRDLKVYEKLGYESFGDFLLDPEIKQKPSTSYSYIRLYEFYIEKLGMSDNEVAEVGVNRLQRLLPVLKVKDTVEAKKIIEEIGSMAHHDYKAEVKDRGFESERPSIYRDDESGKWIIEYTEGTIKKIYNRTTNEVILEYVS